MFTGAAGGVVLLGLMAMVMPPLALIPVHTVVMLGSGITRTMIMWRHVMRAAVLPFVIGSAIGAAAGAKVFVALSTSWLQFILGGFILLVTWMPNLGPLRRRARPLRAARLCHHVPRRVRQRHRHAARAIRRQLNA